ncbi:tetratricopeptide repeat protein [Desulfovibrio sp. OttesenSCG-928-G11]|nr:tetratricopeptide repeat protein [Desulfovibrio sp. OttesenSCG-928-G11]
MKKPLVFLLFCLLALPAQAFGAESAAQRTALEQGRARATALLDAGDIAGSLEIYERLLAVHPDAPELYYEAFKAYEKAGRTDEALRLARAARERFTKGHPALTAASAQARSFVVHGALRAGVLFDSNANQGPSSSMMDLGDWKRVRVKDAKERSTFGAYVGANLDMAYRLNDSGSAWAVGDASVFARGNENPALDKINSREWQNGRAALGLRFLNDNNLFDARLKSEVFDYEFYSHVSSLGPEIRYIHAAAPWLHLVSAANLDWRDYSRSDDRNGFYGSIGEYARFFFGEAGHEFMLGASYIYGGANETDYQYDGWQGTARFTFKLPYDFTASPFVSFGQEFFRGPATVLENRDRRDDRWRTGLDLSYAINQSWSIEASYAYTDNDSKSPLYTYDQHLISMGLAWKF